MKNLNVRTAFSSVDLPRFSRHTQDQITEFLSSLDRKIALNRRKIATLEKMAKEIYDYWFEMKTGTLCIDKWVDRARLFSADGRSRFITCCADERIPTWLFDPYMLIPLGNIEKRLPELLRQEVHGAE